MTQTSTATWGTAKAHGLTEGAEVMFLGSTKSAPWTTGILATVHIEGGIVTLEDGSEYPIRFGTATRFWVAS
jgi:hypothetical protein